MRISDWSSDVCSSDLPASRGARPCACLHTDHKPVAADCRFGQKLAQHFVRAWVDAADGLYNSPDGREHFGRDVWIKGEVASHLGHRQFRRQRGLIDERYGNGQAPSGRIGEIHRDRMVARGGLRSEERRVGKQWFSPCRSRWWQYNIKKKT